MRESRHWGGFLPQFAAAYPFDRVLTIDFAGNGMRNGEKSHLRMSDMVADCRLQLERLGVTDPIRLVALSLGGMVAMEWSRRYPTDIEACVLVNTSMRPFSPFYERLRPYNYVPLLKLLVSGGDPTRWEQTIARLTSNAAANAPVEEWLRIRGANPVSLGNALRQLIAAAGYRAPASGLANPVLVLTSHQDHLVACRCSLALADALQCPVLVHPWAGHDLPLDDGAWVIRQIHEWLD
jgi:pimeloyl-ACP methyl ester carboxylesterase